jgi:hypothetical protein
MSPRQQIALFIVLLAVAVVLVGNLISAGPVPHVVLSSP